MSNNSACYRQSQSTEEIVKILIDFLGEFLLYLSSITECQPSYSQYQLQRIREIAERIHQLRSTLLVQINQIDTNPMNSVILDLPSIGITLQELATFIRCLCKEQQPIGTIFEPSHTTILTQLLDRMEKLTQYCMNCANANSNAQCYQYPVSVINPCVTSPQLVGNSVLSIGCGFPCNESNICMPWSFFERMKTSADRNDQIFGLMYGIQDENVRRKLGYRGGKYRSSKRGRQRNKQNRFQNERKNFDHDRGLIVRSNDGILLPTHKTSFASTKSMLSATDPTKEETSERRSYNSIVSPDKTSLRTPGSNRSISQQPSPIKSKQSSPLFPSHADIEESMRLHSIQDRLAGSATSARTTANSSPSRTGDLPMTSMLDRTVSQHQSSRYISPQPSDIHRDYDEKSAQSLSFQSYGYPAPSKTTIKISGESSQSIPPVQSRPMTPNLSTISTLSPQAASISSMRKKKRSSSVVRTESQRSFQENINENPSVHQTHSTITDPALTMPSHENISNQNWEQRLSSSSPIPSAQRINSVHFSQHDRSPIPSKRSSMNTTTSDSKFSNYSQQHILPSTSFRNETHGDMSMINTIEDSQSVEGLERSIRSSLIERSKERSSPQVSTINTYRQQSTSATYDNKHAELIGNMKKHSFPSMGDKRRKLYRYEADDLSLQANRQGYFHKFMNCFRRTNVDRSRYQNR